MTEKEIEKLIKQIEVDLEKLKEAVYGDDKAKRPESRDKNKETKETEDENIPGVIGTFDGINMITEDGKTFEIPANYAAKSKMIYGDKLKMTEKDGKNWFKQIDKKNRESVEGIVTKKEGEWYVLTEHGSHKLSQTASEYHDIKVNDRLIVLLPKDNITAPFASIDKVEKSKEPEEKKENKDKQTVETIGEITQIDKNSEGEVDLKRSDSENEEEKKEQKVEVKTQKKRRSKKRKSNDINKSEPDKSGVSSEKSNENDNGDIKDLLMDDDLR